MTKAGCNLRDKDRARVVKASYRRTIKAGAIATACALAVAVVIRSTLPQEVVREHDRLGDLLSTECMRNSHNPYIECSGQVDEYLDNMERDKYHADAKRKREEEKQ